MLSESQHLICTRTGDQTRDFVQNVYFPLPGTLLTLYQIGITFEWVRIKASKLDSFCLASLIHCATFVFFGWLTRDIIWFSRINLEFTFLESTISFTHISSIHLLIFMLLTYMWKWSDASWSLWLMNRLAEWADFFPLIQWFIRHPLTWLWVLHLHSILSYHSISKVILWSWLQHFGIWRDEIKFSSFHSRLSKVRREFEPWANPLLWKSM